MEEGSSSSAVIVFDALDDEQQSGQLDETGEVEIREPAAAKKKKKKKEKEKEKKKAATAASASQEEGSKVADKKVPKHVRLIQERLAREEQRKKEEEEMLRKEEEDLRVQQELERKEEEERRIKKEKRKGKPLTRKQKEEKKRFEAMRNQFAKSAVLPVNGDTVKRPNYQTKKSKPNPTLMGKVDEETAKVEEIETTESLEDEHGIDPNGFAQEEDDEVWDAKNWDDSILKVSVSGPFGEEDELESQPTVIANLDANTPGRHKDVELDRKEDEHDEVGVTDTGTIKQYEQTMEEAHSKQSINNLRSPICCIMGHVDHGKTKLLDYIRGTKVQQGEAGGITQQIGVTFIPSMNIREKTKVLKADAKLQVPGLLAIDTPGHDAFTSLRSQGSGLCDIAILVVDIMDELKPQTIESLNLLRQQNTEFIVALNKVDRLYGWKTFPNTPIVKAMKQQSKEVQNEFNTRVTQIITQFKEQGFNTELYYKNTELFSKNEEMEKYFSIVPTSAISGEGIPDLLLLLVQLTQRTLQEKLILRNEMQCTVLEVRVIEGLGTTIDVVLVNGVLHEGDHIVVCSMQGPIDTRIRALLTPHPMKELRVKGSYLHHKEVKAAQCIKITAQGLENTIAGTDLYVVGPEDDLDDIKEKTMEVLRSVLNRIDKSGEGVCVQASTFGSLVALVKFLKSPDVNIPVRCITLGSIHKNDVMKASVMLEKKKDCATILGFDVEVTAEARELADEIGVKIFVADVIYHLFDQFKAYVDNLRDEEKKEAAKEAVFPSILKITEDGIFNKKDPIILGVHVLEGILKVGTPICFIPSRARVQLGTPMTCIDIGRIASIIIDNKELEIAKKGQKVSIKIASTNLEERQKMYGRHFDIKNELYSHISRESIDVLKAYFRGDLSTEDWSLVRKLKTKFRIQ